MADLYETIPPDRQAQYLQNAQEAMNEAAEPVLQELGSLAISEGEELTALDAAGSSIGEEAASFVQENDLSKKFIEEMERPRENIVSEGAEKYLGAINTMQERNNSNFSHHKKEYAGDPAKISRNGGLATYSGDEDAARRQITDELPPKEHPKQEGQSD